VGFLGVRARFQPKLMNFSSSLSALGIYLWMQRRPEIAANLKFKELKETTAQRK
jgi:hypothetical protein